MHDGVVVERSLKKTRRMMMMRRKHFCLVSLFAATLVVVVVVVVVAVALLLPEEAYQRQLCRSSSSRGLSFFVAGFTRTIPPLELPIRRYGLGIQQQQQHFARFTTTKNNKPTLLLGAPPPSSSSSAVSSSSSSSSSLFASASHHSSSSNVNGSPPSSSSSSSPAKSPQKVLRTDKKERSEIMIIRYSPNFQRHIVFRRKRKSGNNAGSSSSAADDVVKSSEEVRDDDEFVQSFIWLDQALMEYPQAKLVPIYSDSASYYHYHRHHHYYPEEQQFAGNNATDNGSSNGGVAGTSVSQQYPLLRRGSATRDERDDDDDEEKNIWKKTNLGQLRHYFESRLRWYPSQVDKLLAAHPDLLAYPASWWQERLDFYLAPFPTDAEEETNHHNDDGDSSSNNRNKSSTISKSRKLKVGIDWALQFYQHNKGIGMSIAQLSHALQLFPLQLLRYSTTNICGALPSQLQLQQRQTESQIISFCMTQTPSFLCEMARKQLDPWLTGVPTIESSCMAYLHWKGWEWNQCRALMQSIPTILTCNKEPGWEIYSRSGSLRQELLLNAICYLQLRLQLRPWHIHAMLLTHSRLSNYSKERLQCILDAFQARLRLPSAELQTLILRMPSLLGMSVDGLQKRLEFWSDQVGLTVVQLHMAIEKQPALLQYSVVHNLQAKLEFYRCDMNISKADLVRMTLARPESIWGRSFEGHLKKICSGFRDKCGNMAIVEVGKLVSRAPELLAFNYDGNLRPKLEFLQSRLSLTPEQLKYMVMATPRILTCSIRGSLEPKLELLEKSAADDVQEAVMRNPSLLQNPRAKLEQRIEQAIENCETGNRTFSLVNTLASRSPPQSTPSSSSLARGRKRRNQVWLLDENNAIEKVFDDAVEAASFARVSTSHMYKVLRSNGALKERRYVYASATNEETDGNDANGQNTDTIRLATSTELENHLLNSTENLGIRQTKLTIHVTGRAFPPECTVRGRRRTGGMAMQIHTWSYGQWHTVCSRLWKVGQRLRILPDGKTVLLGYPYTRPSRRRCSLYACREALRVAEQWLLLRANESQSNVVDSIEDQVLIEIVVDSHPIADLLQNSTRLLEWGQAKKEQELIYTGPGPLHAANPDILYPLAKTYLKLTQPDKVLSNKDKKVVTKKVNVRVDFVRKRIAYDADQRLGNVALMAAKLMYAT